MMHTEMVAGMWRAKKNGKNLKFDYNLLISVSFSQLAETTDYSFTVPLLISN